MSALTRSPLVLSVRVEPTGDRAYAETREGIRAAALDLLSTARELGAGRPLASFYGHSPYDDSVVLIRADVPRVEL